MTNKEQKNYDDMSNALREAGVAFEDTTYGNDVTASISVLLPRVAEFLAGRPLGLRKSFKYIYLTVISSIQQTRSLTPFL